jgi:transcriptional regulator of aromatic amino acid metabolism
MVQGRELLVQESFEFTPLEVSFDRAIGQEAQTLNIQMKARVAATLVNQDDVEEVTRANWKPNPRPGFQLTAEGVRILPPEVVKVDGRVVRLASKAEARTVAQVNVARVQQFARWRSSAESEAELATLFDLVRPPEVRIDPGWADRAYRVWVVVDAGEPR